jgi:phage terminase large subunit
LTRSRVIDKTLNRVANKVSRAIRDTTCTVDKCTNTRRPSAKLCNKHYMRQRRHGTTEPRKTRDWRVREKTAQVKKRERLAERIKEVASLDIQTARVFLPLLEPRRYKGAKGGRGSGKSHFFAEMLVERCVLNSSTRVVCIREIQSTLKESAKRLIEDKIESLGVEHHFEVQHDCIHVLDGSRRRRGVIIFMGMQKHTATSIKSLEGFDIAWVEEAQSISVGSLKLLRPTIRKAGSEIWFSWNPNDPKDAVDSLFSANADNDNFHLVEANYWDNPWFPKELEDEMQMDRDGDYDRYLHVWEGHYATNSQARVFKRVRMGKYEEFTSPEFLALIPRYGGDWGYANDPNVVVKTRIDQNRRILYVEGEVYRHHVEIEDTPEMWDQLDEGEIREWPSRADSARPEIISYMQRHGFPKLQPAVKGKNSVKDGVTFLKSYTIVVHPNCKHTWDEFQYYSWKVDEQTGEVLPILEDDKNHVIDSIRYACESVRHKKRVGGLFSNATEQRRAA